MGERYCVVLTTCGSREDADRLAGELVNNRLAACIQILPMTSVYLWDGAVQQDAECLLLIKTASDRYNDLEAFISKHHTYEVPEIIRVPVDGGLSAYLNWIDEVTRPGA